jgi:hypothetical protein
MYIRWYRHPLRRRQDSRQWVALVESVRTAHGPRQRTVCYLGSIRECYRMAPAHRQAFWATVDKRLAALDIPAMTRQLLERQLVQQVPRPTEAELADLMALRATLAALVASPPV